MRHLLLAMLGVLLLGSAPLDATDIEVFDGDDVLSAIMELHKSKSGKHFIWNECGKRLSRKDQECRAGEYRDAIMASISDVESKTGFRPDPRIMTAILFRESSNNECVIGRQETSRLSFQLGKVPDKEEMIAHVKRWSLANSMARKHCKGKGRNCFAMYIYKQHPEYAGIRGWDIGAAQYRWPSARLRHREVMVPSGKLVKTTLENLFDYEVSIQLLAEELAAHRKVCEGHTHWLKSKWGKKVRELSPDEAYYVHHHTGSAGWSLDYWKQINRHLKVIDSVKEQQVADLDLPGDRAVF